MENLKIPRAALAALCRRYGVAQFHLFGSALTPRFDPARSDIDALVTDVTHEIKRVAGT